ncbi:MAG: NTP transferase domain-containing protein [Planctomycetales bacterium]|nr:NTP transferase domain-containing protein [Planctomycetales bacterium]
MDYAVIMAGGTGKRLWPLSRQKRPKQVLKLLEGQTLLRKCFERLEGLFDFRNILVLTNADYADVVRENLFELPKENVIAEPAVRDTAGAIGLAATILRKYDNRATMAVVTADQILEPTDAFEEAMRTALGFVHENPEALVTFGIQPTFPSTQLGYIQFGQAVGGKTAQNKVHAISAFKEKPDQQTARYYLDAGQYRWNSGMFVWRCETILRQLADFLPESVEPLRNIQADWGSANQQQTLQEWFPKLPKTSIDYAVMEKAEQVYGISLDCRWLDMGSFAALADIVASDANNNSIAAEHSELLDCRNDIVVTEASDHLIAMIGVNNMIVAHSKDATLVCPIEQGERIKEILEHIQKHKNGKFL